MSNAIFSLSTLRKAALAAVLLGGTALATLPAHATLMAAGEGASFRTSNAENAGEGETFRTSNAENAGEGETFRISAGEGENVRSFNAG